MDCGFISYIKGRIGENMFRQHVGHGATLTYSVIQEGWDVAVPHTDGVQYIQIKLYSDPHGVVRHMLEVHRKMLRACTKFPAVGTGVEPVTARFMVWCSASELTVEADTAFVRTHSRNARAAIACHQGRATVRRWDWPNQPHRLTALRMDRFTVIGLMRRYFDRSPAFGTDLIWTRSWAGDERISRLPIIP